MSAFSQPKGIAEGVYFHLSNEDYHNDAALSHSGMTNLLISWPDYWARSCLNPQRKEYKATPAMEFGARSGELLLEPEKFKLKYATAMAPGDTGKKVFLSSVTMRELRTSIDAILSVKDGADHFKHGYGEVSIFWRDKATGVMLRAKLDYLRTFGAIDFKRIAMVDNSTIGRAVKAQGLDIQNYLYCEAIKAARVMLGEMSETQIETYAKTQRVDLNWLSAFINDGDLMFRFLFQRSAPPYIWEFRELEQDVVVEGANAVRHAINRYKAGIEKFGTGVPVLGTGEVKTVSQFHIPRRDYDYE